MSANAQPVIAAPLFVQEQPLWLRLLVNEIAAAEKRGGGKAEVGKRLGFSRPYISRVIATVEGRVKSAFPGGVPEKFIERVIDRFSVVPECPVTKQPRPFSDCRRIGNGPAPTHNPLQMFTWRECQRCPHKPVKEPS